MIYIALVGITLIVVRSTLFLPIQRVWPGFFGCAQCVGAWVGFAGAAVSLISFDAGHLDILLGGGAVSLLALVADGVMIRLHGGD